MVLSKISSKTHTCMPTRACLHEDMQRTLVQTQGPWDWISASRMCFWASMGLSFLTCKTAGGNNQQFAACHSMRGAGGTRQKGAWPGGMGHRDSPGKCQSSRHLWELCSDTKGISKHYFPRRKLDIVMLRIKESVANLETRLQNPKYRKTLDGC